jgi:hypothetical protein
LERSRFSGDCFAAIVLIATFSTSPSLAADRTWGNPNGGNFATGSNWVEGVSPGLNDTALFPQLASEVTVTLNGDTTISRLRNTTGRTTLELGGHTLSLASSSFLEPGLNIGDVNITAGHSMTLRNGQVDAVNGEISTFIPFWTTVFDNVALDFADSFSVGVGNNVSNETGASLDLVNGAEIFADQFRIGAGQFNVREGLGIVSVDATSAIEARIFDIGSSFGTGFLDSSGHIDTDLTIFGRSSAATGTATIRAGGVWNNSGDMVFSNYSSRLRLFGELANGGKLTMNNDAFIQILGGELSTGELETSPDARIMLHAGGRLSVGGNLNTSALINDVMQPTFRLDQGRQLTVGGTLTVGSAGVTLDDPNSRLAAGVLAPAGGPVQLLRGTLQLDEVTLGGADNRSNMTLGEVNGTGVETDILGDLTVNAGASFIINSGALTVGNQLTSNGFLRANNVTLSASNIYLNGFTDLVGSRIAGDVTLGPSVQLRARPATSSLDPLFFADSVAFDGALVLGVPGVVNLDASFRIFDFADGVVATGSFTSIIGPLVPAGLRWDTSRLNTEGILAVEQIPAPVTLAGDYNDDGVVDAADYTLWRDNLGGPAVTLANNPHSGMVRSLHYTTWRANFGAIFSSLATATVPEPTSYCLGTLIVSFVFAFVRRQTSCSSRA